MRIRFENVSKSYDERSRGADGLTLSIEAGEFVGIAGASGSGKTTLLRLIAGLEKPDAGAIYFNDEKINDIEPHQRDTAMVFPQPVLYPHLSVYENIAFGAKMRGQNNSDIRQAVADMAARLEIAAFLGRKPHALSAGQKQRVALAGVLIRRPRVFLLDEPTNHLDGRLCEIVWDILGQLHRDKRITTLCVSHETGRLEGITGRVCVMEQGRVKGL